ncbi:restriction endonuclease subunit S [Caldicellulosiruptor sp. DIB 104C]|uniref:restriction endonuclease subunit S n=1 Tax=Caldicellulosiruptor sp. DIB 104C TaxID=3019889 RepID=UPI002305ED7F|nr:restriction endonuclease subunit S [Caldicellulosiruptor sp. DIB 104C]
MGSEWINVKLGDICNINMEQSPKSETYNENGEGLPFYQGRTDFGDRKPKVTKYCSHPMKIAEKGEVLLSVRAPVGDVNIANNKCCIGRGIAALSIIKGDNRFLYYLLKANKTRWDNYSSGTVFPAISKDDIKNFEVYIPSNLYEQQKIASILSAFDDKIELNNEMNKTLEEIAQAIFKHWFIDFEFPDENGEPYKSSGGEFVDSELGPIPKGWEVKEIKDICKDNRVITGKTPSTRIKENYGDYMMFITIPDMHDKVFVIDTQKKLSRKGVNAQKNKTIPPLSICVSCIATPGLVSLTSEYSQTNQQINSIVCKDDISPYYVYFLMKSYKHHIINLGSGGTATLNLNKSEFEKIKVILPKDDVMEKFHRKVESIFDRILLNLKSNLILSSLRDTLLPKLISGEIRVM